MPFPPAMFCSVAQRSEQCSAGVGEGMDWQAITARIEAAVTPHIGTGKVADYIPALARIDPTKFGMAIVLGDGTMVTLGDSHEPFSIQSISKVFTLSLALKHYGEHVWDRVGREPSGSAFNSIVQLENEGIPRNPLINAGAIVVTDMLVARSGAQAFEAELLGRFHRLSGDDSIAVDEGGGGFGVRHRIAQPRARAFHGRVREHGQSGRREPRRLYSQCAVRMSCRQLARAACSWRSTAAIRSTASSWSRARIAAASTR